MDEWGVLQTIITIVGLLGTVIPCFVKVSNVIQKNTDAINSLTTELRDLTVDNSKDHDVFYSSINNLKNEVAVLKTKHDGDIHLLENQIHRGE